MTLYAIFEMNLSEENREGDEMSGDEHSLGPQGRESELMDPSHIGTGIPGDRTRRMEQNERQEYLLGENEEILGYSTLKNRKIQKINEQAEDIILR